MPCGGRDGRCADAAGPWFNGLGMGLAFTVWCGGQAWRNPARVRALLDDGEELVAAFPVGPDRLTLLRRLWCRALQKSPTHRGR